MWIQQRTGKTIVLATVQEIWPMKHGPQPSKGQNVISVTWCEFSVNCLPLVTDNIVVVVVELPQAPEDDPQKR